MTTHRLTNREASDASGAPKGSRYKRMRWIAFAAIVAATLLLWFITSGSNNPQTRSAPTVRKPPTYERIDAKPPELPPNSKATVENDAERLLAAAPRPLTADHAD